LWWKLTSKTHTLEPWHQSFSWSSLTSLLYKEWHGYDKFEDNFGGVDERNQMYGCR
jgi:hypothetical protein